MVDPTTSVGDPPHATPGEHDLFLAPVFAALASGSHIARYVVLEQIGAGGMGVVYAAYDPELDRKIAIKLLQSDGDVDAGSLGRARLLREAQALARLTHPNVVAVHDVGTWEQRVFVAMEFVRGATLGRWLKASPRTPAQIVEVFMQAGAGLGAAHEAGLMHRDFKPENMMVGDDGRVRVLDFGLARTAGASLPELEPIAPVSTEASDRSSRVDSRVTRTGTRAGTPAYMAPEQHRGDDLDPRADQFSFCVSLWEALCGERPFGGKDRLAVAFAVCGGQRRPMPAGVAIPTRWRRALERGLSSQRDDRFVDMAGLLAEFAPRRSRTAMMLGAGVITVGLAAAVLGTNTKAACANTGARMEQAWGPQRSAAITEAFTSAHASLGPDTARRVVTALDRYAQDWSTAAREACVATHERHEQSEALLDRRSACLGERLRAMTLLVDSFVAADAEVVPRAVDATAALPLLSRCADVEALLAELPVPEDPQQAALVDEVRREIVQAEIGGRLGHYAATYAATPALLARAHQSEHKPVIAEAELITGELASAAGHDSDAVRHLRAAVLSAIASGHDRVHLRAAAKLASVVGISQSHYEEGLAWASQAGAALERVGTGGPDHARTSEMMCQLLADKGEAPVALAHCLRALELAQSIWGDDDQRTAQAHHALGLAQFVGGRYAEAEHEFLLVEAMVRRDKGDDHPDLAQLANALAGTCFYQRGAAACLGEFERATEVAERAFGPDHDSVADITNNFALMLVDLGEYDKAEQRARRALAIRRAQPFEHPGVAASLGVIGRVEAGRGNVEAANAALDESIAIYRRTRGRTHPDVMGALRSAATERARQGDLSIARAQLAEALEIAEVLQRPPAELTEIRAELAAVTRP